MMRLARCGRFVRDQTTGGIPLLASSGGVARNPKCLALDHKTMHVCCAESSVDRDYVLVPEIFLTVQGGRRFLSRSGRWQCLRQ